MLYKKPLVLAYFGKPADEDQSFGRNITDVEIFQIKFINSKLSYYQFCASQVKSQVIFPSQNQVASQLNNMRLESPDACPVYSDLSQQHWFYSVVIKLLTPTALLLIFIEHSYPIGLLSDYTKS